MTYENDKLEIEPTEYTSSIGDSINAFHTWPASIACHLLPASFEDRVAYIDSPGHLDNDKYWDMIYDNPGYAEHRTPIVGIVDGAEVGFKYLNFGE